MVDEKTHDANTFSYDERKDKLIFDRGSIPLSLTIRNKPFASAVSG